MCIPHAPDRLWVHTLSIQSQFARRPPPAAYSQQPTRLLASDTHARCSPPSDNTTAPLALAARIHGCEHSHHHSHSAGRLAAPGTRHQGLERQPLFLAAPHYSRARLSPRVIRQRRPLRL
ncbi:predicted protein [Plenodomus lingam JN3]|uniref:Predicted protein n=1 Tax=Leptosphaeria maculans (strain JN3 / isolate v23.1.3 / race Av1-4-5-6-7-8) TaxID=985895 RepID=E5A2J8_LEPMJ|nr:predicted protein [Plenodomus lingam JN3]CBX97794.1 predicted protein [Plenodomus lingam JN3]